MRRRSRTSPIGTVRPVFAVPLVFVALEIARRADRAGRQTVELSGAGIPRSTGDAGYAVQPPNARCEGFGPALRRHCAGGGNSSRDVGSQSNTAKTAAPIKTVDH
jgi:hypothetical protein